MENPSQESESRSKTVFVEIEVINVQGLTSCNTNFILRDASQQMRNFQLYKLNKRGQSMIEKVKLSAEALSHEMRAPLASIIMIIDIILSSHQPMPQSQRKYMKQIKANANLLMNFVQDLLDMRQISNQQFQRKVSNFDP